MAEALSREEILALQQALRQGRLAGQGGQAAAAPRGRVRRYDFAVPDKFSKEALRALQHLHDGLARSLTTSLSAHVRAMVQVASPDVRQQTYQQFIADVDEPAVLAAFSAEPLPGLALCAVDGGIAFALIDRLLGGPGQALEALRALTEIELTVIQRVVHVVLEQVREAWGHIAELRPRLQSVETNPLFVQLAGPNEIVLGATFAVRLGAAAGQLRLCLPFTLLEPILGRLVRRGWQGAAGPRADLAAELAQALQAAPVPVRVELGRTRLPLQAVLDLRPGDVLPLPVRPDGPVTVYVRDAAKFAGRAGRLGRRLAVEIAHALTEEGAR
jgi:flagellar motor switch protein FliM